MRASPPSTATGRFIEPEGETVVEEGDEIFFVAARDNIQRMMSEITRAEETVRKVLIAGGGNIGFRLARLLEKHYQVKLIERDAERARRVSERLEAPSCCTATRRTRNC